MIISNPPFHDGMQTSLDAAQTLIRGAVRHLNSGGELRIVANAFLPYPDVLDETFGFHGCGVHAFSDRQTNYPQFADGHFSSNYTSGDN